MAQKCMRAKNVPTVQKKRTYLGKNHKIRKKRMLYTATLSGWWEIFCVERHF